MKIVFKNDVLNDERYFNALSSIVYLILNGKHKLCFLGNPEEIENTKYFNDPGVVGKTIKSLYYKSIINSLAKNEPHVVVTTCVQSDAELLPKDAYSFLSKPLSILVEDSKSDGLFVKMLAKAYSTKLTKAIGLRFLKIEHGGGSSMKRRVEQIIEDSHGRHRLFVLSDSDRQFPDDNVDEKHSLINVCLRNKVPNHLLKKREMENYIPEKCIRLWLDKNRNTKYEIRRNCLNAYEKLKFSQKDYYDMKNGVCENSDNMEVRTLFSSVSTSDRKHLYSGFGRKVYLSLEHLSNNRKISKLLRERSNYGLERGKTEVEEIVKKIEKLL